MEIWRGGEGDGNMERKREKEGGCLWVKRIRGRCSLERVWINVTVSKLIIFFKLSPQEAWLVFP